MKVIRCFTRSPRALVSAGKLITRGLSVRDAAIAAIANMGRLKQAGGLLLREARKEAREPGAEFIPLKRGAYALRFHQRG